MRELALHVLDVLENSVAAGATRIELTILEDRAADRLEIEVTDNGCGMSREMVDKVLDPFTTTRTTRAVGLGLPLLAAAARRCEGDVTIQSELGKGTRVRATFRHSHLDRAPLGDVASTVLAALLGPRPFELNLVHAVDGRMFGFDTAELRRELGGGIPLSQPQVREYVRKTLEEGEAKLRL